MQPVIDVRFVFDSDSDKIVDVLALNSVVLDANTFDQMRAALDHAKEWLSETER